MTFETLLKAAEAAGFAMASDENEQAPRKVQIEPPARPKSALPKDVLSFTGPQSGSFAAIQEPLAHWTRTQLANFLPVWHAKV